MLQEIKDLITSVNSSYVQTYESKAMDNIMTDEKKKEESYILIEEFTTGKSFITASNILCHKFKVQLSCYKFSQLHDTAEERQELREQIMTDIYFPLTKSLKNNPLFADGVSYDFPPSQYDANETCVMISFDYPLRIC